MKQSESALSAKALIKESIGRVATALWVLGFVAMFFVPSVPPTDLGIWAGLFCLALIPAFLGVRRYRIFGVVALSLSLLFIGLEELGGRQIKAQRAKAERAALTNSSAVGGQK
jgi:hypothetical protein